MIVEMLESLFTKVPREARRLGYLYESIALQRRYLRHRREWKNHIDHCHRQVLASLGDARTIAVLGSGPLVEIPMRELIERCDQIRLVDFVHPRDVRAQWGTHPKVELIEADLLGIAKPLLAWNGGPLPEPRPLDIEADFVLSANCLSQLPLKPRQFLEGKVEATTLDAYAEKLSLAHLRAVAGRRHLVIADFETRVIDEKNRVIERTQPFYDIAALQMRESWNWRLAPPGEIYKNRAVEMRVGAFTIL